MTAEDPLGTNQPVDNRLKDFIDFKVIEKKEDFIHAELKVSEQLPSFSGHFPGDPILPAVSIIDVSLHLLSTLREDISYSKIEVKRSKFMAMVRPNQEVKITAQSVDGKSWKVLWTSAEDDSRLSKVQLTL